MEKEYKDIINHPVNKLYYYFNEYREECLQVVLIEILSILSNKERETDIYIFKFLPGLIKYIIDKETKKRTSMDKVMKLCKKAIEENMELMFSVIKKG